MEYKVKLYFQHFKPKVNKYDFTLFNIFKEAFTQLNDSDVYLIK